MMKANEFRNSSAQHLSGFWLFKTDPGRVGEVENWAASFPEECEQVPVPSCWNNLLGKFDYCGAAWYNTSFYAPGGNIKILFEGVSNSAKVYFDGEYLGSHYGAFTSFSFIKKWKKACTL